MVLANFLRSGIRANFSRLVVSMVMGFLQSLVPATSISIGAAFLRPAYENIHQLTSVPLRNTRKAYFCDMNLSIDSQICLQSWVEALSYRLTKQT